MTQLVGILNVTPDSFSDGGQYFAAEAAIRHAERLFSDGASLVDIGAESTRPGATPLTAQQEWERLEPVLADLLLRFDGKLSLDTYHPENAQKALTMGDIIINDVTGMTNPAMVAVIVQHKARCIISQLAAGGVQAAHTGTLIDDENIVLQALLAKRQLLASQGVDPSSIIFDPGIGFGKTPELNKRLLSFARLMPGHKVMIGYSRKRFLGEDRMELAPNLRAGQIAIDSGASYLRVHDVKGHSQLLY
ncbi:MAG: dihydropteroate synthase [Candidatus Saccharibacteria bacterium]|nr:dihydropteroate synthase [Candidatus Saccharibacteria bacterium]